MELDFCSFQIKIALNFNFQGNEKFELSSQGTYNFQNLRNETLVIADYEYAKISRIAVMDVKLWVKEDLDLHTDHPLKFIQIHSSESARFMQNIFSFSHNFISNIAKLNFSFLRFDKYVVLCTRSASFKMVQGP